MASPRRVVDCSWRCQLWVETSSHVGNHDDLRLRRRFTQKELATQRWMLSLSDLLTSLISPQKRRLELDNRACSTKQHDSFFSRFNDIICKMLENIIVENILVNCVKIYMPLEYLITGWRLKKKIKLSFEYLMVGHLIFW